MSNAAAFDQGDRSMPRLANVPDGRPPCSREPPPATRVARFEVRYTLLSGADGKLRWTAARVRGATPPTALVVSRDAATRASTGKPSRCSAPASSARTPEPRPGGRRVGIGRAWRARTCCLALSRDRRDAGSRRAMSEILLYWGGDERGMAYAGPQRRARTFRSSCRSPPGAASGRCSVRDETAA